MEHIVKILDINHLTHDVKRFVLEKPLNYKFEPGQATNVSVNNTDWKNKKRPFSFTSLNTDNYLEFIIKIYTDHNGVTNELNKLKTSDELIIGDPWGVIKYKGPGYFIAGGAGITPFIAIFRQLFKEGTTLNKNFLYFSNKTGKDIILHAELQNMLGDNFINIITDEKTGKYLNQFIDKDFLQTHINDFTKQFYVCGPPNMTEVISAYLKSLGANPDAIIF